MIRLENIQKNYSEKPVLRDISFEVKKGSIYALLGTNGVGKTTTLKIISGLLNPTSGCVMIDGKNWIQSREDNCQLILVLYLIMPFYMII